MSLLPEKDKATLRCLIAESISDDLAPQDQERLEALLQASEAARTYYIECLGLYTDLYDLADSHAAQTPTFAEPQTDSDRPHRLRLPAWITIAALLILGVWIGWRQANLGPEIGTIVDTLDLQANWSFPKQSGQGLRLGQGKMRITAGLAHLHLDHGVDLILEAPCTFELLSASTLALGQGRLYAHVTEAGRAFTVKTVNAKIVDMGTEFGIISFDRQGAEVHVFSGLVEVSNTSAPIETAAETLVAEHALRISPQGSISHDVLYDPHAVVRRIDSHGHMAWRGQYTLNLADVVSGGDGFGTGQLGYEIDPQTGQFRAIANKAYDRQGNYRYQAVDALSFVDGVFVPDGEKGPIQVTSAGHKFTECPDTCNVFFSEILGCSAAFKGEAGGRVRSSILNGIEYGTPQRGGIFMHANLGITFDLQRIREALGPDLAISGFQATMGISEATNYPNLGDADMWILIDGQVAYVRHNVKVGQAQAMTLPIGSDAQFLTLVTTDSQSGNDEYIDTMADWCTFGEPKLILQPKSCAMPRQ